MTLTTFNLMTNGVNAYAMDLTPAKVQSMLKIKNLRDKSFKLSEFVSMSYRRGFGLWLEGFGFISVRRSNGVVDVFHKEMKRDMSEWLVGKEINFNNVYFVMPS